MLPIRKTTLKNVKLITSNKNVTIQKMTRKNIILTSNK